MWKVQFACVHLTQKRAFYIQSTYIRTCGREPKLSASHISISSIPEVITHSAPLVVDAYLHSTLKRSLPILEPDIAICTCSWWRIWI